MSADTKECPYCAETIKANAKKCIHCGEYLDLDQGWTGFRGKTLWDVLGLIGIPLALAIVGFYLANLQDQRQMEVEANRANANTLQAYLSEMAAISSGDLKDETVSAIRARTMGTIRELDGPRNAIVVIFLYETGLLGQLNLPPIKLNDANLSDANLSRASLRGADLRDANLRGADLRDANLREADLLGADLSRAQYNTNTQWPGDFDYITSGAIGPLADLHGIDLSAAYLGSADLHGADLRKADLRSAGLIEADLSRTDLSGANLRQADLVKVNLSGASLTDANISDTELRSANLSDADLSGADLSEARLYETNLLGADLNEAILTGAKYDSLTIWPDGFNPEKAGAVLVDDEGNPIEESE